MIRQPSFRSFHHKNVSISEEKCFRLFFEIFVQILTSVHCVTMKRFQYDKALESAACISVEYK